MHPYSEISQSVRAVATLFGEDVEIDRPDPCTAVIGRYRVRYMSIGRWELDEPADHLPGCQFVTVRTARSAERVVREAVMRHIGDVFDDLMRAERIRA